MVTATWMCDRCGVTEYRQLWRDSDEEAKTLLPPNWEVIKKADLCGKCSTEVTEYLRPNSFVKWVTL